MALGSTQPLKEMSTRSISWVVKAASAWGWQPYHLDVPIVQKFWEPQPPGARRAYNGIALSKKGCYTVCSGKSLMMFWDNLSVLSLGVKKSILVSWPLKMSLIGCPELSVRIYHFTLRNNPEECRSYLHHGRSLKHTSETRSWNI